MEYLFGQPCWADLGSGDPDAARTFYAAVMNWQPTPGNPDFGGYGTAMSGDAAVAGMGPLMGGAPAAWTLYFSTDDSEETAAAIITNGGVVLMPPHEVGDFGRLTIAQDPTGAVFGLWQRGQTTGFDAIGRAGAWAWCDLRTPEPDVAREFYGNVFGWQFAAVPMAGEEYTTFTVAGGDGPSGGIGPMMGHDDAPPHWLNYFAVTNVDESLAEATQRGGTSLAPAFDTPFGRMAPVLDLDGVPLVLMTLPN